MSNRWRSGEVPQGSSVVNFLNIKNRSAALLADTSPPVWAGLLPDCEMVVKGTLREP